MINKYISAYTMVHYMWDDNVLLVLNEHDYGQTNLNILSKVFPSLQNHDFSLHIICLCNTKLKNR